MARVLTGYTILDATGFADLVGALCLNDHVRLSSSNAEHERSVRRIAGRALRLPHAAVVQAEMRGCLTRFARTLSKTRPSRLRLDVARVSPSTVLRWLNEQVGALRRVQYEALLEVARAGRTRFHVNLLLRCTMASRLAVPIAVPNESLAQIRAAVVDLLPDLMHVLARELTDTRASDERRKLAYRRVLNPLGRTNIVSAAVSAKDDSRRKAMNTLRAFVSAGIEREFILITHERLISSSH